MHNGNNKKKIAFFMTNTEFRGGVIALYYFLKNLDFSVYEPLYITCSNGEHVDRISRLNIKCYVFPIPLGILNIGRNQFYKDIFNNLLNFPTTIKSLFQMASFLRKEKVGLIHTQDQKSSIFGAIIGVLSMTPVVWHVRDIPKGVVSIIDQLFGIFVKKIIPVSEVVAEPFKNNLFLKKKTLVIYDGIDTSIFRPDIGKNKFRLKEKIKNKFIVGQVASLIPLKGIQYFIKAAHQLLSSGFEGIFILIGDNKIAQYKGYESKLKQMVADFGIEEHFYFMDFRNDIHIAMAAFDIFVFTSLFDGFGRVLIEAMALKTPVVAFDIGASREIIENNVSGVLVPPMNSEALAKTILKLYVDAQLRAKLGEGGYKKVKKCFEITETIKQIENVYQTI